jgi:hypothetical protein
VIPLAGALRLEPLERGANDGLIRERQVASAGLHELVGLEGP